MVALSNFVQLKERIVGREDFLTTSLRLSQKSHPYFNFRYDNIS